MMVFEKGFHDLIDIYPYINVKGMGNKGHFDTENATRGVRCRIRRNNDFSVENKAFFSPDVSIKAGDGIMDLSFSEFYTIKHVKRVYDKNKVHHISCLLVHSPEKMRDATGGL